LITEKTGQRLDSVRDDQLGSARRVTITKENTTIVGGAGSRQAIEARCKELRMRMADATSEWDKEKLQERLARLTGGVAVIKVGAATETEMKERKARVEDALSATRAAIEEGVVVGGGVSYIRAMPAVQALSRTGDEKVGAAIVARALAEPLRVIAVNAGLEGGVVVERVRASDGNEGFDAVSETYGDLPSKGVIDPTKVVVSALTNATSIATMVLTTEALVAEAPEKEEPAAAGGHTHGGMGGMDDDMDF
jgi:chaperonin GroEL